MADPTRATKNWSDLSRIKNFYPDPSLDHSTVIASIIDSTEKYEKEVSG